MQFSSNDTLPPFDDETSAPQSRLPFSPPDLEFPEPPDDSSKALSVSYAVVSYPICSSWAGFSGGLDYLCPLHLEELISKPTGEAGVCFCESLTSLVSKCVIRAFVFGASLVSLCPIAVGSVFQRLVAKAASLCLGSI